MTAGALDAGMADAPDAGTAGAHHDMSPRHRTRSTGVTLMKLWTLGDDDVSAGSPVVTNVPSGAGIDKAKAVCVGGS